MILLAALSMPTGHCKTKLYLQDLTVAIFLRLFATKVTPASFCISLMTISSPKDHDGCNEKYDDEYDGRHDDDGDAVKRVFEQGVRVADDRVVAALDPR